MPWHTAEQLLAEDPNDGGPYPMDLPAYLTTKTLKPMSSHGSTSFTAVYRCQAPNPECDCSVCWKERSKAKRTASKG